MSTDKILQMSIKAGYHSSIKVTPVSIAADGRVELPTGGIAGQLTKRSTMMIQNTSSGILWVGSDSVGYGVTHGGDSTTCSGIRIDAGGAFIVDAGRIRLFGFNPETDPIDIKIMEIA